MSIKRQLTLLIIATVMLASFFAALHGYRNSMKQLDTVFDQELHSLAEFMLAIATSNDTLPAKIPSEFSYQILKNGDVISQSINIPEQHGLLVPNNLKSDIAQNEMIKNGFSENTFLSQRWRMYSITKAPFQVTVAHPIAARVAVVESILFVTITPILLSIPLIALLIFYIIHKSLKPLTSLSNALKHKSTDDLTAITIKQTPEELRPITGRLNHLFERLAAAFEREKQLTANAAHELRTPVSVLAINAHNIAKDFNNNTLSQTTITNLKTNVQRMAHVIEQIIALYRFNPENFQWQKEPINLEHVLQEVISNNYEELTAQQQNISLEASEQFILGDYFALYTLFENLLLNAIKYSGQQASIEINMVVSANNIQVRVEDSGKGISANELQKIFNRFYRSKQDNTRIKGSGLGLSIVKHIAELHHAQINATQSTLGGLCMTVNFPVIPQKPTGDNPHV